jgi:uncharacterized protein YjbI with pentapeptide repeats
MANEHHLAVLAKGVAAWNQWRQEKYDQDNRAVERFIQTKETNDLWRPDGVPDFSEATLEGANLTAIDLRGADLRKTILNSSCLVNAQLAEARLIEASLMGADMAGSSMRRARLDRACLAGSNLQ